MPAGYTGRIREVHGYGALRRRLLDMGITPGTTVRIVKFAPMGDPMEIELRGYSLTLRLEDAANLVLEEGGGASCQDTTPRKGRNMADKNRKHHGHSHHHGKRHW